MKTLLKLFIFTILIGFVLTTSCVRDDDFSVPNLDCDGVNLEDTKTLRDIYNSSKNIPVLYTEDDVISGFVISSDEGGNFHKEMYLVNEDNTLTVRVPIDITGIFSKFEVGRKLMIKLKGLYTQIDNGILVVGVQTTSSKGKAYVGRIPDLIYKKHILSYCGKENETKSEADLTLKISLEKAIRSDEYLGKLIELTNVQFAEKEIGKTYYSKNDPTTKGGATNRELRGKGDAKFLNFRTSSYAEYNADIIPINSGTITGILTKFNKDFQFISRSRSDIQLTKDRFNDDNTDDDTNTREITIGKYLVFPASDFEDWGIFISNLSSHGIKDYAKQNIGQGWETSNALEIKGTPTGNDYVFTALNGNKTVKSATKISFLIKGTSARSLSINLYKANGTNYEVFNLGTLSKTTIKKAEPNSTNPENGKNSYTGKIDTKGEWVKVTLDLMDVVYNTTPRGNIFALKVGKENAYDLLIDEIRFEDGTLEGND